MPGGRFIEDGRENLEKSCSYRQAKTLTWVVFPQVWESELDWGIKDFHHVETYLEQPDMFEIPLFSRGWGLAAC